MSFLWKNLGLDVELGGRAEKARPILTILAVSPITLFPPPKKGTPTRGGNLR
jgi:hypothetical protein